MLKRQNEKARQRGFCRALHVKGREQCQTTLSNLSKLSGDVKREKAPRSDGGCGRGASVNAGLPDLYRYAHETQGMQIVGRFGTSPIRTLRRQ